MRTIKKIKIVIAGPFAAGKTKFINTVSEIKTVKTERRTQAAGEKECKRLYNRCYGFWKNTHR